MLLALVCLSQTGYPMFQKQFGTCLDSLPHLNIRLGDLDKFANRRRKRLQAPPFCSVLYGASDQTVPRSPLNSQEDD